MNSQTQNILKNINCLVMDVDGVLTDGKLMYTKEGETIKAFHVHDGLGLHLLHQNNIITAIISGRSCEALSTRLKELNIEHIYTAQKDKIKALHQLQTLIQLPLHQIAYVGDDLPDLEPMQQCGVSFAVDNALDAVKEKATFTTEKKGGEGAVREICDLLLKARNL